MKTKIVNKINSYQSGIAREDEWITGDKGTVIYTLDGDSNMIGTFVFSKDDSVINISRQMDSTGESFLQVMEYKGVKCTRKFVKA